MAATTPSPLRNSKNKSTPAPVELIVYRDAQGVFAARDVDCDWVVNRAGLRLAGCVAVSYANLTAWVVKNQPRSFRETLLRSMGNLRLARCEGIRAYILSGELADELLRRRAGGDPAHDLATKICMIAGAAEAEAENCGWTFQAFLQEGGPKASPCNDVVYL